ncbi:MAG TPA: hypothetical protein ENJ38_00140 [Rhodospirillales bacterium]|nr:hypothetical protein [Rhodospirillales bacterium]
MWLVGDARYRYRPQPGITAALAAGGAMLDADIMSTADRIVTAAPTAAAAQVSGSLSIEYPAALRTVNVSTAAELSAALASAQPGDHIVLADGAYGGSGFATAVSGTSANPVVIRAANKLAASLTAKLTAAHAWYILWGLDFDDAALGVDPGADDLVVRRCRARNYSSYQGIWCRVKAPRALFDRCELTLPNSRGISFDLGAGGLNGRVYKCWFHDWGTGGASTDQTFEPIQIGFGAADTDTDAGAVVELSLFENVNQGNRERECISIKSSGNTVKQCHLKDARLILVRHGNNNRIDGCRVEKISGAKEAKVGIFDKSNVVITTVADRIDLFAGDIDADSWGPGSSSSLHPAAEACKVVSCTAPVRVGYQESSSYTVRADANAIEDHSGTVTLLHEQNTTQAGSPSETGLPTITLTAADVGPDAP